jgi:hypothetical protein
MSIDLLVLLVVQQRQGIQYHWANAVSHASKQSSTRHLRLKLSHGDWMARADLRLMGVEAYSTLPTSNALRLGPV